MIGNQMRRMMIVMANNPYPMTIMDILEKDGAINELASYRYMIILNEKQYVSCVAMATHGSKIPKRFYSLTEKGKQYVKELSVVAV